MRERMSARELKLMSIIGPYLSNTGSPPIRKDAPQEVWDAWDEMKKINEKNN